MLRAGNKNCNCKNSSLCGVDPTGPAELIGRRLDLLNITNQSQLNAFDSSFAKRVKGRHAEIAAVSGFKLPKYTWTPKGDLAELTADLQAHLNEGFSKGALRHRRLLLLKLKGGEGALEELGLGFNRPRSRASAHPLAAEFLGRFRSDPAYTFHDFGVNGLYKREHRGLPMVLVIAEYCRRRVPGKIVHFRLPLQWAMNMRGEDRMKALLCLIRVAIRQVQHLNPKAPLNPAILWERGAGSLGASLSRALKAIPMEDEFYSIVPPAERALNLSERQLRQRAKEHLLTRAGLNYELQQSGRRGVFVSEVLDECEANQVRTGTDFASLPGYKRVYRAGLLPVFNAAAQWMGGHFAEIAGIMTKSLAEAVALNLCVLLGVPFVYNKMYRSVAKEIPGAGDPGRRQFRFDLYFPSVALIVELLLTGSERTGARSAKERSYWEHLQGKLKFISACGLLGRVRMIDLCDFYGKPRLAFATRFAELLRDSNLIDEIPPVSVLRCACDSVNARAPAPGAVIRRLDTYLQRFSEDGCIRSSVIKALDAAFTSSTPLGTASESLGHDVQKVFREVSRYIYLQRQGGFVFRRTLQNITDTASCPLWNAHWGVAFLDCARLRDSSDMVKAPANLGSRVPPCGVRYLRIGKGRVHACVPGEGRGDPPRYRLFGNVAKDATVIDALGAIASSRGELQLAPEIWPEQKRATLQRHVVLRSPSPECIREIARRVRERSVV